MSNYVVRRARELGLRMVDARADLEISVSREDIVAAKVKNSKCCAFASAVKRTMSVDAAYFFRSTAWIEKGRTLTRYRLPVSVQKEIVSFDRAKTMEPGIYRINRPEASASLREIRKRTGAAKGLNLRASRGSTTASSRRNHRTGNIRGLFEPPAAMPKARKAGR